MEKLVVKDYEREFLQLMGIECVDGNFVRTLDNSQFEYGTSELKNLGSGESSMNYTFTNNDVTINFFRNNLIRGLEDIVSVERNGYNYYAAGKCNMYDVCMGIRKLDGTSLSNRAQIAVKVEDSINAVVDTTVIAIIDRKNEGFNILCTPSDIYTDAYISGDEIVYFGDVKKYSKDGYTDIVGNRISGLSEEEFRRFFLAVLPVIIRTHHSKVTSVPNGKVAKTGAMKFE